MQTERSAAERRMVVVHLGKTLRAPIGSALSHTVAALIRRGARQVTLDLGRLDAIDAAGVGELIAAFGAMTAAGGVLRITRPARHVRRLLHVAGVLGILSAGRVSAKGGAPRAECHPHETDVSSVGGVLSCA